MTPKADISDCESHYSQQQEKEVRSSIATARSSEAEDGLAIARANKA